MVQRPVKIAQVSADRADVGQNKDEILSQTQLLRETEVIVLNHIPREKFVV